MQQEKEYTLPADKVKFIKAEVDVLKANNQSDYKSGEFDSFNHKQEGAYKAYERVLGWLIEGNKGRGVDIDELWDEHAEYIDDNIDELVRWAGSTVVTKEEFKKIMDKLKQHNP